MRRKNISNFDIEKNICGYRVMFWISKVQIDFRYVFNKSKVLNSNFLFVQLTDILSTPLS